MRPRAAPLRQTGWLQLIDLVEYFGNSLASKAVTLIVSPGDDLVLVTCLSRNAITY